MILEGLWRYAYVHNDYAKHSKRSTTNLFLGDFLLLTPPRLNSCSSDSKTNLPKYTTLHLTPPTMLEISASSLMTTANDRPSMTSYPRLAVTVVLSRLVFTARRYMLALYLLSSCVRPSVRLSQASTVPTPKRRITQTTPYDSPGTLVF